MTSERWDRVQEIFLEALERPSVERAAFLEAVCAGDAGLRAEVESLLDHDDPGQSLLDSGVTAPWNLEETEPDDPAGVDAESIVGTRIGPYRLTEVIGRGGMGVVYRAVRDDDAFRREAAIKLMRRGLDSDGMLRRFRHERQILARLDHPNVGRLLDGGATHDGRPYFVMELIEGEPLLDYCLRHNLGIPERLRLFQAVCAAVQYAHQNLIVHRDLKPGNILVTREGVPKLLDFGIAKLIGLDGAPETAPLTKTGFRILTPDYASPEQVRGEPITTASDIYSLGAILFELLTGERAHRFRTRSAAEIERVVCLQETEKPSSVLRRKDELAPRQRRLWLRRLSDDLDNIVMMALRKEALRRYPSVERLSQDIQRYLDGLPVTARKDTLRYRAGKFLGRNRLSVLAASVAAISLLAGTVVAWREAERAQRRFAEVRGLANAILYEFHDKVAELPGSTEARELLVRTVTQYLDRLASDSAGDPTLQYELAVAYQKVGDAQGDPTGPSLGQTPAAHASYQRAIELLDPLVARQPREPKFLRALSGACYKLADLELRIGHADAAAAGFARGLEVADRLLALDPADADAARLLALGYNRLGDQNLRNGDAALALFNYQRGVGVLERAVSAGAVGMERAITVGMFRVGDSLVATGDLDGALRTYRKVLDEREELWRRQPASAPARRDLVRILCFLGDVLGNPAEPNLGQPTGALEHYRRAASLAEQLVAEDPQNARALADLVYANRRVAMLLERENPGMAAQLWRKSMASVEELLRMAPRDLEYLQFQALNLAGLAGALRAQGDRPAAIRNLEQAIEIQQELLKLDDSSFPYRRELRESHHRLGLVLAELGDMEGALRNHRRGLLLSEFRSNTGHPDYRLLDDQAESLELLGDHFARQSRWSEARSWYQRSLQVWQYRAGAAVSGVYAMDRVRRVTASLERVNR